MLEFELEASHWSHTAESCTHKNRVTKPGFSCWSLKSKPTLKLSLRKNLLKTLRLLVTTL